MTSSSTGIGHVLLADQVVALAELKQNPARHTALFARAKAEVRHAVCLCSPGDTVKLVIKCLKGRYFLAAWPGTGHQHAPGCSFYRVHPSLSGAGEVAKAITTTAEGTSIRLATPLIVRGATPTREDSPLPATSSSSTAAARRKLGPLAVLHYLWETAQLNIWHPDHGLRPWRTVRAALVDVAAGCRVNQQPLSDTLWIVPAYQPDTADAVRAGWDRFLQRLATRDAHRRRALVLGEIRAVKPTKFGQCLRLAHQYDPLFATTELVDRAKRSYPTVFSTIADGARDRRQVALAVIERSPTGNANLVELAAMLTTGNYLPVDSSYEATMADALVAAGRAFAKPLRYGGESLFPDFVLIDDTPHTDVEVWGVRGRETYENRKRVKQAHYREAGRALLEWDVREPLPSIARRP